MIIADLVGSYILEDVVRVVGVSELALSLPIVTCTFEIEAISDVCTNEFQRPQYMVMCAYPIRGMVETGVDVVPGTFTTHEIYLTGAWHVRKRSEGRVVGEPEELMKEVLPI